VHGIRITKMFIVYIQLITFLVVAIYGVTVQSMESLEYHGLNQDHFDGVISGPHPLLPINGTDETLYDHSDHDEIVFMDKDCARNESYADYLRRQLLLSENCLIENEWVPQVVEDAQYYHFYLQWNESNADDCLDGVIIDFEAFCISKIEYEHLYQAESSYECQPAQDGWWTSYIWWMDDIEGNSNDGGYSWPEFDTNNLIVYVMDSRVNLDHEHFDHIPDANKQHIGVDPLAGIGDHGTHVAGSIVGKPFGVIHDDKVKLKACNALPFDCDGSSCGSDSNIESCYIAVKNDLIAERASNPDVRGVINLSLGGGWTGCGSLPPTDYVSYSSVLEIQNNGGILLAAAGNDNVAACDFSPACWSSFITVGAYDSNQRRSSFSNYGDCVDAWGPGSSVVSSGFDDGSWWYMSGTSMATPIMSGMVGNLLMVDDDASTDDIKGYVAMDQYSFAIDDCQSAQCRAFSIECSDYPNLVLNGWSVWSDNAMDCHGNQYLGTFQEPEQCAAAALSTDACGAEDGTFSILWSDYYSVYAPSWGCRCCLPGASFGENSNWELKTYHHAEWKLKSATAEQCQGNYNLGTFENAEQCAAIALQTSVCDTEDSVDIMWDDYYSVHQSSWGCRCCKSGSTKSSHSIWTLNSYETESWLGWVPSTEGNLKNCEGDCDSDASCAEGLECYHNGIPPGCTGTLSSWAADYCYDPSMSGSTWIFEIDESTLELAFGATVFLLVLVTACWAMKKVYGMVWGKKEYVKVQMVTESECEMDEVVRLK